MNDGVDVEDIEFEEVENCGSSQKNINEEFHKSIFSSAKNQDEDYLFDSSVDEKDDNKINKSEENLSPTINDDEEIKGNPTLNRKSDNHDEESLDSENNGFDEAFEETKKEWEEIENLREDQIYEFGENASSSKEEVVLNYLEACHYFNSIDKSNEKNLIEEILSENENRSFIRTISKFIAKFTFNFIGKPELDDHLYEELKDVLSISRIPLNHGNEIHTRMIQTVYKKLTGSNLNCPKIGRHWETIGFQGSDPRTDLRGVGMFGILQMLAFLDASEKLFIKIYQLSQDSVQEFPFCIVSLQMTSITLKMIKQGSVTRSINKERNVLQVANKIYFALLYHFHLIWKNGSKSIQDFDNVKNNLQRVMEQKPKRMVRQTMSAIHHTNNPLVKSIVGSGFSEIDL